MAIKSPRYRSNLERTFNARRNLDYETTRLHYTVKHTYTPDFVLAPNRFVETKGRFTGADRSKHKQIRAQHPEVDILLVFQDPNRKLSKASKTSYANWCDLNNFCWMSAKDAATKSNFELILILEAHHNSIATGSNL